MLKFWGSAFDCSSANRSKTDPAGSVPWPVGPRADLCGPQSTSGRGWLPCQVPNPHQVVDRQPEDTHPADAAHPPMPRLPEERHGLDPAEDLLDDLPRARAHGVAGRPGGPPVDRAAPV